MSTQFSPKTPNETVSLAFDWSKVLASDETISSESVTASVGSVSGVSSSGAIVSFRLSGGSAGDVIKVVCSITTSVGQILEEAETIRVRAA